MPKAEPTSEPAAEIDTYIIDEDEATPVDNPTEEDDLIETDLMYVDKTSYTNYFLAAVVLLALFGGVFYWIGGIRWLRRAAKRNSRGQYRKVGSNGEDLEK